MKGILRGRLAPEGEAVVDVTSPIEAADPTVDRGDDDEIARAELQEFLEADRYDVPADPAFKERLREMLWEMVTRMRRDPPDGT